MAYPTTHQQVRMAPPSGMVQRRNSTASVMSARTLPASTGRAPPLTPPLAPGANLPRGLARSYELDVTSPLLGHGAFAKIFRISERSTGRAFALKVMEHSFYAQRGIENLIGKEVEALRRCASRNSCRHILRLLDAFQEEGQTYIRTELCRCSLLRHMQAQPAGHLEEAEALRLGAQLCLGLADLHGLGILHRDIKPDNLLLCLQGELKIADFGWCCEASERPSSMAGTFQYMAPEVLRDGALQTEAVDVWSAAASLLEIMVGRPMLPASLLGSTGYSADPGQATKVRCQRLIDAISMRCPLSEMERPSRLSSDCWGFLRELLMPKVHERATLQAALAHSWLRPTISAFNSLCAAPPVGAERLASMGAAHSVNGLRRMIPPEPPMAPPEPPEIMPSSATVADVRAQNGKNALHSSSSTVLPSDKSTPPQSISDLNTPRAYAVWHQASAAIEEPSKGNTSQAILLRRSCSTAALPYHAPLSVPRAVPASPRLSTQPPLSPRQPVRPRAATAMSPTRCRRSSAFVGWPQTAVALGSPPATLKQAVCAGSRLRGAAAGSGPLVAARCAEVLVSPLHATMAPLLSPMMHPRSETAYPVRLHQAMWSEPARMVLVSAPSCPAVTFPSARCLLPARRVH